MTFCNEFGLYTQYVLLYSYNNNNNNTEGYIEPGNRFPQTILPTQT